MWRFVFAITVTATVVLQVSSEAECTNPNEVYDPCDAPCPARRCDFNAAVVRCVAPPKVGDPLCLVGCRCIDGYLRDSNGVCIPAQKCPKCTEPNQVYDQCPDCTPQTCKTKDKRYNCPLIPANKSGPNCQPACRCKPGYFKNLIGVCISASECDKCPAEHEYYSCGSACDNVCATLSEQNQTNCPIVNIKCNEMCYCENGYARATNNTCIPINDCKASCGGDENAKPGCGTNCGRKCSDIGKNVTACQLSCRLNGCDCKDNYYYDATKQKCVPERDCKNTENEWVDESSNSDSDSGSCNDDNDPTPVCRDDEELSTCANGLCRAQNCTDIGKLFACQSGTQCIKGCVCPTGKLRAANGICIKEDQCPNACPAGEVYSDCPPIKCDGEYCPKDRFSPQSCPIPKTCGKGRCVCGFNSHRDRKTDKCIRTSDCPAFKCEKDNEAYNGCPSACPDANCPDYLKNVTCPNPRFKELFVVACKPACRCQSGYYRDSQGNCVCAAKCEDQQTSPQTPPDSNPNRNSCGDIDSLQWSLGEAINTLDVKSLYQLDVATPGVSTVLSAFSYSVLLAQLALYAKGQTYTELINVLNVTTKDDIRCGFPGLIKSLQVTQGAELDIGNKIYVNDQYQLSDQYKNDSVVVFNAGAESINFNNPTQATNTINKWVSESTKGKITDLVSADMLNAMTRLVLANAIYFKGIWKTEFNPNLTQSSDFYVNSQKTIKVQMMQQKGKFNYADSSEVDAQLVEIPYQNENISFVLASPNKQDGLRNLLDKMRDPAINIKVLSELCQEKVTIFMPKFNISSKINVIDLLKPIGVQTIFGSNAELSGMVVPDEALYVSDALQKVTITVNEQGSEAAAATAIGVTALTASIQPPREFIVRADRPFLYGIKCNNMFLFSGLFYG